MKQALLIIAGSALATAAVIKAAPALAEPNSAENVNIVATADLDLSTEAGRQRLDHRLVIAARDVCGEALDVDVAGENQVRQCRSNVLAEARAKGHSLVAGRATTETIRVAAAR
jgi:UrcA family protein